MDGDIFHTACLPVEARFVMLTSRVRLCTERGIVPIGPEEIGEMFDAADDAARHRT